MPEPQDGTLREEWAGYPAGAVVTTDPRPPEGKIWVDPERFAALLADKLIAAASSQSAVASPAAAESQPAAAAPFSREPAPEAEA